MEAESIREFVESLYDNVVAISVKEVDGDFRVTVTRGVEMPEIILHKTLDKVKGLCYTIVKEDKTKPKGKRKQKEVD